MGEYLNLVARVAEENLDHFTQRLGIIHYKNERRRLLVARCRYGILRIHNGQYRGTVTLAHPDGREGAMKRQLSQLQRFSRGNGLRLVPSHSGLSFKRAREFAGVNGACGHAAEWDTRTCLAWRLRKREERGVYAASAWDNPGVLPNSFAVGQRRR